MSEKEKVQANLKKMGDGLKTLRHQMRRGFGLSEVPYRESLLEFLQQRRSGGEGGENQSVYQYIGDQSTAPVIQERVLVQERRFNPMQKVQERKMNTPILNYLRQRTQQGGAGLGLRELFVEKLRSFEQRKPEEKPREREEQKKPEGQKPPPEEEVTDMYPSSTGGHRGKISVITSG